MSIRSAREIPVPDSAVIGADRARDIVTEWIVDRVAEFTESDPDEIESDAPFVELGLTSVQAVEISDQLCRWTGIELPPTIAYDYPTIDAVAEYIVGEQQNDAS